MVVFNMEALSVLWRVPPVRDRPHCRPLIHGNCMQQGSQCFICSYRLLALFLCGMGIDLNIKYDLTTIALSVQALQTAFPRDFLKALLGMIALAKPQVSKIPKARAANRASQAEARRALGRAKIANGAGFDHSFANHGQNRRRLQTPSLQSPFARGPLGETYAVTGTPSPKSSSCSGPVRAARAWSRRLFMPLRNWRYITSVR